MTKHNKSLMYAMIIGLIIVVIFMGFLSSFSNPISWVLIAALLMIPVLYNKTSGSEHIMWKDEYSVGIRHIDNDHKKLIDLLNQFTIAYEHNVSESFETEALQQLIDYTKYHFEREEKLMQKNDYPDFEAHQAKHKEMINQVNTFVELYNEKGHDAFKDVCEFLTAWLINHINGTDKEYSQYLNNRGVH